MINLITIISLIIFSTISSAADPAKQVQELQQMFNDVPLPQRLEKRIEYALRMASDQNDTPYPGELTHILYSMNLKEDPTHGETYVRLMFRILRSGYVHSDIYSPESIAKADSVIKTGLRSAPDNTWIRMGQISLAAVKKENLEPYRPQLNSLRQSVQSLGFRAQRMLADIYDDFKDTHGYSEMLKLAESNSKTPQEKASVITLKAVVGLRTNNFRDCIDNYQALMQFGEISYANKINLLACYNGAGRFDDAIALGEKIGSGGLVDCHVSTANWFKGRNLLEAGNFQDAERYLHNATKACSKWELYHDLGIVYEKLGNTEKAKHFMTEAERRKAESMNQRP